jgi:preprotein translocase subunit SecD
MEKNEFIIKRSSLCTSMLLLSLFLFLSTSCSKGEYFPLFKRFFSKKIDIFLKPPVMDDKNEMIKDISKRLKLISLKHEISENNGKFKVRMLGLDDYADLNLIFSIKGELKFRFVTDIEDVDPDDPKFKKVYFGSDFFSDNSGDELYINEKSVDDALMKINLNSFKLKKEMQTFIEFKLDDEKSINYFSNLTENNVKKRLAIILDDKIITAPVISDKIPGGEVRISFASNSDFKKVYSLYIILKSGPLKYSYSLEKAQ